MSNYTGGVNERRKRTLQRLEKQLIAGVKPEIGLHILTVATTGGDSVPLTSFDKDRIQKEISTLKDRIK